MRIGGTDLTNISQTYVLDTCKRAKGNVEMVEYKSGKFAFQGKALVDWMLKEGTVLTQEEAMKLANLFVACKLITKVVSDKGPMQAFSLSCLYVLTIKPSEGDKAKANSALGVLRLEYGCARHLRASAWYAGEPCKPAYTLLAVHMPLFLQVSTHPGRHRPPQFIPVQGGVPTGSRPHL